MTRHSRYFTRLGAIVDERDLTGNYRAHVLVNLADTYRMSGAFEEVESAVQRDPGDARPHQAVSDRGRQAQSRPCVRASRRRAASGRPDQAEPGVFWQIGDWWNVAPLLESAAR